jgi:hemolysin activation/secretion protein
MIKKFSIKALRNLALGGVGICLCELFFTSITLSQVLDENEINTIFQKGEPDFNQRRLNQPPKFITPSKVDLQPMKLGKFDGIKITDLSLKNAEILGDQKTTYTKLLTENLIGKDYQNLKELQAEIDKITTQFSSPERPISAAISGIKFDKEKENPTLIDRILEITINQSSLLDAEGNFLTKNITVEGSTVFSADELDQLTELFKNRWVNLAILEEELVKKIEEKYNEQGFLSTRATVSNITLDTGNVVIRVFEDQIVETRIEGNERLNDSYILSRVMRGIGTPLNWNVLEEQIQLLKKDPLIKNITPTYLTSSLGQAILELNIIEAKVGSISMNLANNGGVATAPERATYQISHGNLTGWGDSVSFRYRDGLNFNNFNRSRSNNYRLGYTVPFNALGGTIGIEATSSNGSLIKFPGITNEYQQYNLNLNQPIITTPDYEVILGLGFRYSNAESFDGRGRIGDSNTVSVLSFSQAYNNSNWELFSQFNFGLPILGATENPLSQPDGEFFSWNASTQYQLSFATASSLTIKGDFQIAANPLLGMEQYGIGGLESVRGFRQDVRGGDNGLLLSVQVELPVVMKTEEDSLFSVAPYFNLGYVWNHPDNPEPLDIQRFLAGTGLGLFFKPTDNLDIRLFFTVPLVNLENRGNNIQDDGIYFFIRFNQPF